jgi:hypothetical protein
MSHAELLLGRHVTGVQYHLPDRLADPPGCTNTIDGDLFFDRLEFAIPASTTVTLGHIRLLQSRICRSRSSRPNPVDVGTQNRQADQAPMTRRRTHLR